MSRKTWPDKDPDDVKDYQINWALWLGDDTIDTSTWTVPSGLTGDDEANTGTTTTIWLSGGANGAFYDVLNRIVTAGGRTMDQTVRIYVKTR